MHAGTRLAVLLVVLVPASARAQGFLEQFSYEGLRLAGLGGDLGAVWSDRLDPAISGSLRVDAGFIAPHLRPLVSVSLLHSRYAADEIRTLEDRLNALVIDPTGQARIMVDTVTLTNITLDLDLQFVGTVGLVLPYAGLGLGIHIRNAAGPAIDGTFLEEALQAVVAALNATAGVEVRVSRRARLTAEVRGVAASGLSALSLRGGAMIRFPGGGGL